MTNQTRTQIQIQNWVTCKPLTELQEGHYYVKGVYELQLRCHSIPCYMTVGSMIKPIDSLMSAQKIVELAKQLNEWEAILIKDLSLYDEKRIPIGCHDYIDVTENYIIVARMYGELVISKYTTYRRKIESIDPIWCP